MKTSDERIGRNLQHLRGEMSQSALASAMKERGWRWSQPTVAAIEKGERSLKLAETADLADLLGIEMNDLLPGPGGLEATEVARAWGAVQRQLDDALTKLASLAHGLNDFADLEERNPEAFREVADSLWGPGDDRWPQWVVWTTELITAIPTSVVQMESADRYELIGALLRHAAQSVVTTRDPAPPSKRFDPTDGSAADAAE